MDIIKSWIMTYLDPIAIVLGILVAFPVFWSWAILLSAKNRQQKLLDQIRKPLSVNERAMALAIGIGELDITSSVNAYLAEENMEMKVTTAVFPALNDKKVGENASFLYGACDWGIIDRRCI